jgi:hypothetical protein
MRSSAIHNVKDERRQIKEPTCEDIMKVQSDFYSFQNKHVFFRKSQKQDCANYVVTQIPLDTLLKRTIMGISETNVIYMDYTVFKTYATSDNYVQIARCLLKYIQTTIETYGSFDLHMNLQSFSMSAAERYMEAIQLFCEECHKKDENYLDRMGNMYIYNTPNMVGMITTIIRKFTNDSIKEKLVCYSKEESAVKLRELLCAHS